MQYKKNLSQLRHIAELACKQYQLSFNEIKFIHHGENTTYRLYTDDKQSYLLRLHRINYQTLEYIESELNWLQALAEDTELNVQRIIHNADDEVVTTLISPFDHTERMATLLTWETGRIYQWHQPWQVRLAGATLARLHNHVLAYQPPESFTRPVNDIDLVLTDTYKASSTQDERLKQVYPMIQEQANVIISTLGRDPQQFNLTHSDFHAGNCVIRDGVAIPIDFDDCCYGYFLYDIASSLVSIANRKNGKALITAFVDGYQQIRDFDERWHTLLSTAMDIRNYCFLAWLLDRGQENSYLAQKTPELFDEYLPTLETVA